MMTADLFLKLTGRRPSQDDLERVNCPISGLIGHQQCGWCETCEMPRFECWHLVAITGKEALRGKHNAHTN